MCRAAPNKRREAHRNHACHRSARPEPVDPTEDACAPPCHVSQQCNVGRASVDRTQAAPCERSGQGHARVVVRFRVAREEREPPGSRDSRGIDDPARITDKAASVRPDGTPKPDVGSRATRSCVDSVARLIDHPRSNERRDPSGGRGRSLNRRPCTRFLKKSKQTSARSQDHNHDGQPDQRLLAPCSHKGESRRRAVRPALAPADPARDEAVARPLPGPCRRRA